MVADPSSFKADLLMRLGLDEDAFAEHIRIFREYRDRWVAHLDAERRGFHPRLEIAKKAVWFYYAHVEKEQIDRELFPKPIEIGYRECEEEACGIYRRANEEW